MAVASVNSKVPIEQIFDSRLSRDKDYPTFIIDPIQDAVGMQILWVNVPFSFYVIDELNNRFYIYFKSMVGSTNESDKFNAGMADTWVPLDIKPGTYTPQAFQMEFRRVVVEAGIFVSNYPVTTNIFCLINTSDGKMTIYHTLTQSFTFGVRFDNEELADILGFQPGREVWSTAGNVWTGGVPAGTGPLPRYVTGEYTVKMNGPQRLVLHGTLSGQNVGSARINDNSEGDTVLSFPITNNVGSYLFYQPNQIVLPIDRTSMSTLSFYFTQGDRKRYVKRNAIAQQSQFVGDPYPPYEVVNYLPFNGEGFQVCIRFITDNGVQQLRYD